MNQIKSTSLFSMAVKSKNGKTGLCIGLGCIAVVILLMVLRRIFGFELPFMVLVLPGFGSMVGMQMFANEANLIRMAMDENERAQKM